MCISTSCSVEKDHYEKELAAHAKDEAPKGEGFRSDVRQLVDAIVGALAEIFQKRPVVKSKWPRPWDR